MDSKKAVLIIMDGWGIAENPAVSAIDQAETPFYDHARSQYPFSRLEASGRAVGLPKGQMGNSEVGHMNLGAGRTVFQDLEKITTAIEEGEILNNAAWKGMMEYCLEHRKPLHIMGLISDGGVHSSLGHLIGLLPYLKEIPAVYVHCFTDGRDTDPQSAIGYIAELETAMEKSGVGQIASVVGRYYAMDRDKRWGRIRNAYDLLVYGIGTPYPDAASGIRASYDAGVTDEFIRPFYIQKGDRPVACIRPEDAVLFINFRSDRARQLTEVLTQHDNREYNLITIPDLYYVTMTRYDEKYKGIQVLFEKDNLQATLGEVLSNAGKTQLRIAETEKYPHVTFFFNGGREEPFPGEDRILCPSPRVATYDQQPRMSADEVCAKAIQAIRQNKYDFICINFANPDMVGHTGVFEAAMEACQTVDGCVSQVVEAGQRLGYSFIILADHGNADKMQNEDGSPNTAHTTALVPCILISDQGWSKMEDGKLGDVAPTILRLMGIQAPEQMTGKVLCG